MTIICAMHEPGVGTWVGTDSRVLSGQTNFIGHVRKTASIGPWVIAHAGVPRALSLVARDHERIAAIDDPFALATALRDMLREDGFVADGSSDDGTTDYGQRWMAARADGLWDLDGVGSVVEVPTLSLWARGSGRAFALGAGYGMAGRAPHDVVRCAVEAACAFDPQCGGSVFVTLARASS